MIDITEVTMKSSHKKHKTEGGDALNHLLKTHDVHLKDKDRISGFIGNMNDESRDIATEVVVEGMITKFSDSGDFEDHSVNSNTLYSRRTSTVKAGSFFEDGRFER